MWKKECLAEEATACNRTNRTDVGIYCIKPFCMHGYNKGQLLGWVMRSSYVLAGERFESLRIHVTAASTRTRILVQKHFK